MVKARIAIAAAVVALIAGACSVVSVPIRSSVEARLLSRAMTEAEFGGTAVSGGGLHFKMFEGEVDIRPIRVPMIDHFGGLPAVMVRLNERHSVKMLADTGAQLCILDAHSVLAAGGGVFVPRKMDFRVTGVGGNETAWIARFDRADIGDVRLNAFTTLVRRHRSVTQFAGVGVSKIPINLLGCPVFLGFAYVTFDYPGKELIFSAGTVFQPSRDARAVPINVSENLITVPISIGGHTIAAVVDTGANDQIFLNTKTIRNFGLEKRAESGGTYRAVGLGGEIKGRQFDVPLAFIGDVPVRDVTVDVGDTTAWSARIGTDLLEKWKVTFDFRRKVMWLEP